MAKVKIGRFEVDEAELDRQHQEAKKRGEERLKNEPRAVAARYDRKTGRIVVELNNGCVFMFPAELAQGLRGASPDDLAQIELSPYGFALHWEKLDADFSVAGLLAGIFGTRKWMEELRQRARRATSEAKRATARENGKKGGRTRTRRAG